MSYAWRPGDQAGSVRSHTQPSRRRKWQKGETIKNLFGKGYRAYVNNAIRAALPLLETGEYDISLPRRVRGWDPGDDYLKGHRNAIVVEAVPDEEPPFDWGAWLKANANDPRFC